MRPCMYQGRDVISTRRADHGRRNAAEVAREWGVLTGLPNDIAFQKAAFTSVSHVAVALVKRGCIGGSGAPLTYPGPGATDNTGVKNLTP